jgi:hypothetical protein
VAAAIEPFLLRFPGRRLVVGGTPSAGTLPTMVLSATEGTTQVPPACVSRMRKKANPAVRAVRYAPLKLGMGLQDRVQHGLILPDKRPGAIELMPIGAKREKLLDGDGKKARLSTILPIVFHTPSSYPFDANASRGRTRFLCVMDEKQQGPSAPTIRSAPSTQTILLAESARIRCASHPETTTWKKEALFSFPSSMAIYLSRAAAI